MTDQKENTQQQPTFQIHKLYVKDASFETEGGAEIFKQEWKPELNVQLNLETNQLENEQTHEVVLTVKCEVKSGDIKAFSTEVDQAGIFTIGNMEEAQKEQTLKAFCPNILYPYAREAISDMVMKGGFPQLCLAPVNFDASAVAQNKNSDETTN